MGWKFGALFLISASLMGCPLARPKEIDCKALANILAKVDAKLAPYASLDVDKLTPAWRQSWGAAIRDGRAEFEPETIVKGDVKSAEADYVKAITELRTTVEGGQDAPNVKAAQAKVVEARAAIDRTCPKP